MSDMNTHAPAQIYVDDVIYSGTGFGHITRTGAACYISSRIVQAVGLRAGDYCVAKLVPNPLEERRDTTPYAVSYVVPDTQEEPDVEREPEPEPEPDVEPEPDGEPEQLELALAAPVTPGTEADALVVKGAILAALQENAYVTDASVQAYLQTMGYVSDVRMVQSALDRMWRRGRYGLARYAYTWAPDGMARGSAYTLDPQGVSYTDAKRD